MASDNKEEEAVHYTAHQIWWPWSIRWGYLRSRLLGDALEWRLAMPCIDLGEALVSGGDGESAAIMLKSSFWNTRGLPELSHSIAIYAVI